MPRFAGLPEARLRALTIRNLINSKSNASLSGSDFTEILSLLTEEPLSPPLAMALLKQVSAYFTQVSETSVIIEAQEAKQLGLLIVAQLTESPTEAITDYLLEQCVGTIPQLRLLLCAPEILPITEETTAFVAGYLTSLSTCLKIYLNKKKVGYNRNTESLFP